MSKADDLILANGPYPPMPAVERRLVGLAHHPTIWEVAAPMIATLPNGSRVALPAGTVLREGSGGIDSAHLLARLRAWRRGLRDSGADRRPPDASAALRPPRRVR